MEVLNDLLGYKNIKIYQNTQMFSFSLDSVLLANFVNINKKVSNILDIGTGNAPIPLILSKKTDAKITGVEIQEDVFSLAMKSIQYNKLQDQITVINDDINNKYKEWNSESFDIITCNPPFFKITENVKLNESVYKRYARHEITLNIEQIFKIARKLLKNNGTINLVHRPDRLVEILSIMEQNNIEPKRLRFIYPRINESANMVLIEGVKMGKSGVKIESPLIVHDKDGNYTEDVKCFFS